VDLQVELLCEVFVAVGAPKLGEADMNHFNVLVQISLLRKAGLALLALVRTLASVGSQVLEKFAH
jgi:hypothetical protein